MKVLYFKVFPESRTSYVNPRGDRVRAIGIADPEPRVIVGEEKEVLEEFVHSFLSFDPDRIVGFKQDQEDFPLLIERARENGVKMDIGRDGEISSSGKYFRGMILRSFTVPGRENVDLFTIAWRDFPKLPTKEIDEMAAELEVGEFRRIPNYRLKEMSDEEITEYGREYIRTLMGIAEEIIPFEESLSSITQVPLERQIRMTVGELVEAVVSREMERRGIGEMRIGGEERYEGGIVWLKSPGVYENVVYLDFQSMYPNIIKVWNISPETVDADEGELLEVEGEKFRIKMDVRGVIPSLIEEFLSRRMEIKRKLEEGYSKKLDAEQKALKVIANAMYGYMGWSGARYYNRRAAKLIAALARKYIRDVWRIIEEEGGTVVYVDTDGIQFTGISAERVMERIEKELPISMDVERIAYKAVYWSKKKYAHLHNGKVIPVGLEYLRRDYPPIVKNAQREIIRYLLEGRVDEARRVRADFRERIREGSVDVEDLVMVEQLTKKPEEYERPTKASVAARYLKEFYGLDVHRGMFLYIVIVRGSGGPTSRARPVEAVSLEDVDREYYLRLYDDTMKRTFEPFNVNLARWF